MPIRDSDAVCLIIPPAVFLIDERVFPSLGILKVAAVLENADYRVDVLDLSGISNYCSAVGDYIAATDCRIFGITASTPQMPQVMAVATAIRELRPDAKLILGGPHVTLTHTAAKKERIRGSCGRATGVMRGLEAAFDVLVSGDGEKAVFVALKDDAPHIVDADELRSPLFLSREEFTASPFPARHLIDLSTYGYSIDGEPSTSIVGQLGCPFSCGFCGGRESPCLRTVRIRSTGSIVREITALYERYGYTGFMFYDDELNVNPHFTDLLDDLISLQVRVGRAFHFRGFVKAELFTDRQARAMYQAGFRWILSGFETGSSRILRNINKRATREDNSRCIAVAREHGLKVKALMSLGHPGESPATIDETRTWLLEAKPDDVDITIITPYPGSSYHDRAVRVTASGHEWVYTVPATGDRLYSAEIDYAATSVYYKGDPGDGYRAFVHTDALTADEIVASRQLLESEIRSSLSLPFPSNAAALHYEHSMGQAGTLPRHILNAAPAVMVA